eukprot:g17727.t1
MAFAVLDANFVITTVNDEYVQQMMSRRGSVGTRFVDIFGEDDQNVLQDALARAAAGSMETFRGIGVFSCGPSPNDFPTKVEYNWTLMKHNDGVLATAAPAADTTGPSSSEAEELKDFFNKAPIALHWLSSNGKVLWANDRELEVLGYSREEYIGADIMNFCPDSKDDVLEIFKQLGSGNTIRDVPVRFRTKTGKVKDLLIDSNVNYHADGSFNHTRCFIRDDTGRKVREARAEAVMAAEKEIADGKRRFSAKLLHNIRTPLHIMSMTVSDPSAVDLPVLAAQVRSLSGLCTSVALAMKFHDGFFITPLPTTNNLCAFVREYRKVEGVRHEVFVEEIGFDESLNVTLDARMVKTVLDELVAHADWRCSGAASIRLAIELQKRTDGGEQIEFRVVDDGPELDEARVEKVFHNYWLEDEGALDRLKGGSGEGASGGEDITGNRGLSSTEEGPNLRLNIAFNYVECLGSILSVDSNELATTFKFSVPLHTPVLEESRADDNAPLIWKEVVPAYSSAVPASGGDPPHASGSDPGIFPKHEPGTGVYGSDRKHILIAEDNTICQKMCKRIVTRLGHMAETADNGAIAVEMATKSGVNIYDMVLMDLRMPVMDGIEAALKIHKVFPELPIVAFSAEDNEETRTEALRSMVAFMEKPANLDEMKRIIEEHAGPSH